MARPNTNNPLVGIYTAFKDDLHNLAEITCEFGSSGFVKVMQFFTSFCSMFLILNNKLFMTYRSFHVKNGTD